jgi:acid phosphatase (class A)
LSLILEKFGNLTNSFLKFEHKRRGIYMIAHFKMVLSMIIALAVFVSCSSFQKQSEPAEVAEIRPGILAGYLRSEELPNSLVLLPPPPAEGSAGLALDRDVSLKSFAIRGTPRWTLATRDAEMMFPDAAETFSCALNAPITEQDTPHLYRLLRRTLADAAFSTFSAKKKYQRMRPFMVNGEPICRPDQEKHLKNDGSYPSGHTAFGWAWALILTEIAPERTDAILARGRAFGQSRIICNVHWHSDVVEGRFVGSATVARLHADPAFRAELEAAKAEFAVVRSNGLKPTRDCKNEVDALLHQ